MATTTVRLLRLLTLLGTKPSWTGGQLADRLGVGTRTVRADVGRLRELGYPVESTPGVAGGYRLGPGGSSTPPLLLDDDEAVAVAVGLRTAAGGSVTGIEEASLRALAKLDQVLPARLRRQVSAVQSFTVAVPGDGPTVDPEILSTVAAACRDQVRLRVDYRNYAGTTTRREIEPHRLVHRGKRWYVVAWDVDRTDWRTFRLDRLAPRLPHGRRFATRELPHGGDIAAYVADSLGQSTWRTRARVTVHAPREQVARRMPPGVTVEEVDATTSVVAVGSDDPTMLAAYLGMIGADFEVDGPPELVEEMRVLAGRYLAAIGEGPRAAP